MIDSIPIHVILAATGVITLLEGGAAALFMWITRNPLKAALYVIMVNLFTVPLALILTPTLVAGPAPAILIGLAASVVIEATILAILLRKKLKVYETVALVLALNVFSTLVGMISLITLLALTNPA